MKIFLLRGILLILFKFNRFTYLLLSLERLILGMLINNMSVFNELNFIVVLVFGVASRTMGLVLLIHSINCYGSENVKF